MCVAVRRVFWCHGYENAGLRWSCGTQCRRESRRGINPKAARRASREEKHILQRRQSVLQEPPKISAITLHHLVQSYCLFFHRHFMLSPEQPGSPVQLLTPSRRRAQRGLARIDWHRGRGHVASVTVHGRLPKR